MTMCVRLDLLLVAAAIPIVLFVLPLLGVPVLRLEVGSLPFWLLVAFAALLVFVWLFVRGFRCFIRRQPKAEDAADPVSVQLAPPPPSEGSSLFTPPTVPPTVPPTTDQDKKLPVAP